MMSRYLDLSQKKTWVSVGAIAFALGLGMNAKCHASTGSWSAQPAWGDDESSPSVSRRSTRNHESRSTEVSPFAPGSNNIALDLGQVFLMGDLTKNYADSLGTQLHYTYGVSNLFSFDSSMGYSQHSNGQYSMATLLSGIRMNLSWYDKVIPYGLFGLGFYKPSYADNTAAPSAPGALTSSSGPASLTAVLFGVHLGGGVDLELSRNLFFGAALTFHNMFGTQSAWANGVPLSIGGSYTSFFLHIGATF